METQRELKYHVAMRLMLLKIREKLVLAHARALYVCMYIHVCYMRVLKLIRNKVVADTRLRGILIAMRINLILPFNAHFIIINK